MREIYTALGSSSLITMGNRTEAPLVEQAVNTALNQAFEDAEALLLSRLGEVTLAMLRSNDRLVARAGSRIKPLETAS